jgi:hypothetical protein
MSGFFHLDNVLKFIHVAYISNSFFVAEMIFLHMDISHFVFHS